jgi:enoyl-CoA hydratase/carnithine racemase
MPSQLQSTSNGSTLVLTLLHTDPQWGLDPSICAAGIEALNVAERSQDLRCVVIAGAAGAWGKPAHSAPTHADIEHHAQRLEGLHNWIETIRSYSKPVVAAVEGTVAGDGLALALACDLLVAARDAMLAPTTVPPGHTLRGGIGWFIAQALPRHQAAQWLFSAEPMRTERLHQWGLVNRIAEPGEALSSALALGEQLGSRPLAALASTKELLQEASSATLAQQLAQEKQRWLRSLVHPSK